MPQAQLELFEEEETSSEQVVFTSFEDLANAYQEK